MTDKLGEWFKTISKGHLYSWSRDVFPSFYVVATNTVVGVEFNFER
jgi:hypothetical protein